MGHFKFLIVPMALGWSTCATAQTVYEKVLADTVGQYSSVVSVVAKGTGGAVLLAEYVNWPDTADSGFRLFEVDDMGEVVWSHAITFPSLGWPGGHEPYLTTRGRSRALVARNDGSGYTFVGKAPSVQGRGLLVSTDLAGAVTWSATTEVVPNGIAQAANGDVLVYGWDSLQSFSTRVERYDPSGALLWSQLNPVAFGPAWSGAATLNDGLLIFHGFGLERRLSQLDASGRTRPRPSRTCHPSLTWPRARQATTSWRAHRWATRLTATSSNGSMHRSTCCRSKWWSRAFPRRSASGPWWSMPAAISS
ncbi:MAG TPA: hypothetical protein PKE21_04385 [Flavobacteriales bacterium]|nr:hypothetical protein [Flavobacteriales bacterium]HMR26697.1 hypothetical protein [Flavobacteriales bacterium]